MNYTIFYEENPALKKVEVDVVVAMVENVFKTLRVPTKEGSFLLKYQEKGKQFQRILAFDFENGPLKRFRKHLSSMKEAERVLEMAEKLSKSKKALLNETENMREFRENSVNSFPDSNLFLSVCSEKGRFLCACYGERLFSENQSYIYCTVAKTLAKLKNGDATLNAHVDRIIAHESEIRPVSSFVIKEVDNAFSKKEIVEIKRWNDALIESILNENSNHHTKPRG